MDESLGITLQQPPTLVALSCSPLQQVKTGKIQIGERTRQKVFSNQLFIIIADIELEQIETIFSSSKPTLFSSITTAALQQVKIRDN